MQCLAKRGGEPLGHHEAPWWEACRGLQLSTALLRRHLSHWRAVPAGEQQTPAPGSTSPGRSGPQQAQNLSVTVPRVGWTAPQACTTACSPARRSSGDWSEPWRGPPRGQVGKDKETDFTSDAASFHTADVLNSQRPQPWLLTLNYCGLGIIWAFQGNHGY